MTETDLLPSLLIIDDDPIMVDIIESLFEDEIRIFSALNGKDGVEQAIDENPDLILLDIRMGDQDGYETCRQLKAMSETEEIPVIFLTARTDAEDEFAGLELGAIDYITKPVKPQIVKVRIQNHLNQKILRDQLANMSMVDGLTAIANRRRFDDYLSQEIRRSARNKYPVSLMMIDIDDFKSYNDTYGHQQGDACLKTVAQEIQNCTHRPSDLVARYGGEEFSVILPDTPTEAACMIAEKVRAAVEALNIEHSAARAADHVTVSIGLASAQPEEDISVDQLIERADKQLYASKENGRNRVSGC